MTRVIRVYLHRGQVTGSHTGRYQTAVCVSRPDTVDSRPDTVTSWPDCLLPAPWKLAQSSLSSCGGEVDDGQTMSPESEKPPKHSSIVLEGKLVIWNVFGWERE